MSYKIHRFSTRSAAHEFAEGIKESHGYLPKVFHKEKHFEVVKPFGLKRL